MEENEWNGREWNGMEWNLIEKNIIEKYRIEQNKILRPSNMWSFQKLKRWDYHRLVHAHLLYFGRFLYLCSV
jgi:hypothetical protein